MKKLLLAFTISFIALGISATPVYPPTLISPTDSMIDQMPNVVLNWSAVAAAVSYKVQVDTDPGFNSPDLSEYFTNLAATHAHQLSFAQLYYWRVKSYGVADSSNWSDTWSFTVIDVVTLNNPSNNNGYAQMPDLKMEWFQLTGVSFYEYEVDTNLLFDSPALQEGKLLDTASYVYGNHLLFDAKYYWRVRAGHTVSEVSSWCIPWSYITLRTFLLTGPPPQATMQMPNVQLTWKEVTGINFYEYELSEDSLFASPMSFVTNTEVNNAEELSFGTKYYFRARAVNDNDESDWTDVRYFTVVEKVALSSPANNSTNVSIRPVMKWNLITGISSYQLQYADNPAFNNAFDDTYPATQTEYQVEGNGLDSATVYYWRLRAIHSQDTSEWSDVWNYKIAVTGIEDIIFDKSDIHIYPNPTSEEFFIKLNSEYPMDVHLSVMDLLGQVLLNKEIHFNKGENTREIKLKNLNNGIYLVKLQKGSEQFVTKIVIDKH